MSRSVSAPSSVTKTSPCWNGLIVPGSTFRYGSNFCSWTRSPRDFSRRPSEAATIPLPSAETTPPVTKTYFGAVCSRSARGAAVPDYGRSAPDGGEGLLTAEHSLELGAPLVVAELLDLRVRRVSGDLFDAEMAVGKRCDLRQMRDRDHLRALGEAAQGAADGVCRLAADARVDLVEDEGLSAGNRGDRERDARELAAGRRLGDRGERHPRVRADQERGLVPPRRTRVALAQLDTELPVAHADVVQLVRHRFG